MIDYILNNLWQMWAIVAVVCLILELTSGDFFIICFGIGGLCAAIAAATGLNFYWQLGIFIIFSVACIFTVRPVALRWFHRDDPDRVSNADALVGRQGTVAEDIPAGGQGYVRIDGDMWRAVSHDGQPIASGASVTVTALNSTVVTVTRN